MLFLDEVDALGQKRSHLTHSSAMRNTVNPLLTELDALGGADDGVFGLDATNHRGTSTARCAALLRRLSS